MVKISVIVPVYNVEEYLEECLDSIINQTLEDIEIICVNDGSTDNSLKILKKYAKKDNRIKIINQKNCGSGCARNSGLNQSQGDYIFFLDSDDFIPLNALELTYDNAISNNSDLIMFKIARFDDFKDDYSKPGFPLEDSFNKVDFNNFTFTYKNIKKYVLNSSFSPWSKLYKKDFLEKWRDFKFPINIAYEDVLFHVKAVLRSSKISFVPEFLYNYRTSNVNSITHTESNAIDIFKVCDSVELFLKNENYFEEFEKEFYEFKVTQILQYLFFSESEEYFTLTKRELAKINSKFIPSKFAEQYSTILNSSSLKDLKIKTYKSNIKNLEKENKKLNKQNKELNKELKKVKKLNNKLINSNSWKITKPIRSVRNKIRK